MATDRAFATKRLLRDIKEVLQNPLFDIVALPLEDVFVWHGNVRQSTGPIEGTPIHFCLLFDGQYPAKPPEVRLYHAMPHPNVVEAPRRNRAPGSTWRLALWDCVPSFDGWSCAYSVSTILTQLQAFLLDDDLQFDTRKASPDRIIAWAEDLDLRPDCPHAGDSPWPQFHSQHEVDSAPRWRLKAITRPPAPVTYNVPTATAPLPRPTQTNASTAPADDWTPVVRNHKTAEASTSAAAAQEELSTAPVGVPSVALTNAFASLANAGEDVQDARLSKWSKKQHSGCPKKSKACGEPAAPPQTVGASPVAAVPAAAEPAKIGLSASALRRHKRALRKAAATAAGCGGDDNPANVPSEAPDSVSAPVTLACSSADDNESATVATAAPGSGSEEPEQCQIDASSDVALTLDPTLPAATLIAAVHAAVDAEKRAALSSARSAALEVGPAAPGGIGGTRAAMGPFGALGQDVMALIMARLAPRDVASLGATCRGLRRSAEDGLVWKTHLQRCFPSAVLPAAAYGSWRRAYLLEANFAAEQLRCSVSKVGYAHAVLGLPIRWTVNPATKVVDYIEALPDLMSTDAFDAGVRKGVFNETIQGVLPVYIDAAHFERALPHLQSLLPTLAPDACEGGRRPAAAAWLDVIARAINTTVVLLAAEGVCNSDAATRVLCALHRLLLALAERFGLWREASARVHAFLVDPEARTKARCPNLGLLLPLLTLAPKYAPRALLPAIIDESLDRSILWLCKFEHGEPGLRVDQALQSAAPSSDPLLVAVACRAACTANRLLMFHMVFLHQIARPPGRELADVMASRDALLGMPSYHTCERMRAAVKAIMAIDSNDGVFGWLGVKYGGDEWMTRKLRLAWRNSLQKRYHRRGMDFSKVHRSGVSRILLKGALYTAPPNLARVEVTDHWRWAGDSTVYLDATCVAVQTRPPSTPGGAVSRILKGFVDYSSTSSRFTRVAGAITHSGDVMDYEAHTGQHTISIDLGGLGLEIDELYIAVSAWAGRRLSDVQQPFVTVRDPVTEMELCKCLVEDVASGDKARHSAIVMCKLFRGNGRWHVQTLACIGQGAADNMGALCDLIHPGMRPPNRRG